MLHRIKWEEDLVKNADDKEIPNSCVLVWEGMNQRRHFGEFKYKSFSLEKVLEISSRNITLSIIGIWLTLGLF